MSQRRHRRFLGGAMRTSLSSSLADFRFIISSLDLVRDGPNGWGLITEFVARRLHPVAEIVGRIPNHCPNN